jgi:hypothetical protein
METAIFRAIEVVGKWVGSNCIGIVRRTYDELKIRNYDLKQFQVALFNWLIANLRFSLSAPTFL